MTIIFSFVEFIVALSYSGLPLYVWIWWFSKIAFPFLQLGKEIPAKSQDWVLGFYVNSLNPQYLLIKYLLISTNKPNCYIKNLLSLFFFSNTLFIQDVGDHDSPQVHFFFFYLGIAVIYWERQWSSFSLLAHCWFPTITREFHLPCYLNPSWRYERWIYAFLKSWIQCESECIRLGWILNLDYWFYW